MQKTILRIVDGKGMIALQEEVNRLIEDGEYRLMNLTATAHPWEGKINEGGDQLLVNLPAGDPRKLLPPTFLMCVVLEHAEKAQQAAIKMAQMQMQAQQAMQQAAQQQGGPRVLQAGGPLMGGPPRGNRG